MRSSGGFRSTCVRSWLERCSGSKEIHAHSSLHMLTVQTQSLALALSWHAHFRTSLEGQVVRDVREVPVLRREPIKVCGNIFVCCLSFGPIECDGIHDSPSVHLPFCCVVLCRRVDSACAERENPNPIALNIKLFTWRKFHVGWCWRIVLHVEEDVA